MTGIQHVGLDPVFAVLGLEQQTTWN